MELREIRERLMQSAGVYPSSHWLEDCLDALSSPSNAVEGVILQQILHHDLRDVVREFEEPVSNDNHVTMPSKLLRRAVQESRNNHQAVVLPKDFALMVQVEELLDISQNAETRLAIGPASPNAPTPLGNQNNRCLKLALADGYTLDGSNIYRDENEPHILFTAAELVPIPDLSVNSFAGVKVLLHGPIAVRNGLLLLSPPHATVLGGQVQELVEIQRKALEQAKRVAGVGIDPTVRALIWNPETGGMDDDEQEGEMASGDVAVNPPQLTPPQSSLLSVAAPQVPTSLQPSRPARPPLNRTTVHMPSTAPSNPYIGVSSVTAHQSRNATSNLINTSTDRPSPLPSIDPSSHRNNDVASRNMITSPESSTALYENPFSGPNPYQAPSTNTDIQSSTPRTDSIATPHTIDVDQRTRAHSTKLSFSELYNCLQRAFDNHKLYSQLYGQLFVVQAKQVAKQPRLYFNIEKDKTKAKDDKKKFQYTLHARFHDGESHAITCRISDEIMEPYFGKSASDMHKLKKEDRKTCDTLVMEGGARLQESLYSLNTYHVSLWLTPDEFAENKLSLDNEKVPILYFRKRI